MITTSDAGVFSTMNNDANKLAEALAEVADLNVELAIALRCEKLRAKVELQRIASESGDRDLIRRAATADDPAQAR